MKKKLLIEGMSCNHCVNHVKNALLEIPGITEAIVDLEAKSAVIESGVEIADALLEEAIVEEAGFELVEILNLV